MLSLCLNRYTRGDHNFLNFIRLIALNNESHMAWFRPLSLTLTGILRKTSTQCEWYSDVVSALDNVLSSPSSFIVFDYQSLLIVPFKQGVLKNSLMRLINHSIVKSLTLSGSLLILIFPSLPSNLFFAVYGWLYCVFTWRIRIDSLYSDRLICEYVLVPRHIFFECLVTYSV